MQYATRTVAALVTGALAIACPAIASGVGAAAAGSLPPPRTIAQLRAEPPRARLRRVRDLEGGPGFSSYLVAYRSSGLDVHALVAVPSLPRPAGGYPVLVANHGFHPDPPRYGITAAGVDSRPGDYYRPVPALYARRGYLVVMPDYRGHSVSQGTAFARGALAPAWYAEDVVALLSALRDLPEADPGRVFLWGHSMGGEITLRALLVADRIPGIVIRAASLWSTTGGDIWEQVDHRARSPAPAPDAGSDVPRPPIDALRAQIAALAGPYDWAANEPLRQLEGLRTPVILHHAHGDASTRYEWSERLARELYRLGREHRFHSYAGGEHFFAGDAQRLAADRDDAYFREHMTGTGAGVVK
jgi:dipeptidyl aminopeptidase/acylaminoacyl peptidase